MNPAVLRASNGNYVSNRILAFPRFGEIKKPTLPDSAPMTCSMEVLKLGCRVGFIGLWFGNISPYTGCASPKVGAGGGTQPHDDPMMTPTLGYPRNPMIPRKLRGGGGGGGGGGGNPLFSLLGNLDRESPRALRFLRRFRGLVADCR